MKLQIILAQPDPASFCASLANAVAAGAAGAGHEALIADLVAEGFDPQFRQADLDCYHGRGPVPDDVLREQARIDAADALVLVFPVYWWSLPAVLKGWIDRVFIGGWAFKFENGAVVGTMRQIPVVLIGTGGGNDAGYVKHGYYSAFETQVESGIFRFCGMEQVETRLMLEVEGADAANRAACLKAAQDIGRTLIPAPGA